MNTLFPVEEKKEYVILSASRMTDMPKYYPQELIKEVHERMAKGVYIHTLVLWTKHPSSIFSNPLFNFLQEIKNQGVQLYIQLTITGLGGITTGCKKGGIPLKLEPNAPLFEESLSFLPKIIEFIGDPRRIRLRIDPIVRIMDANNKIISNLIYFQNIVENSSKHGVKDFSFSFLEKDTHIKVAKRFKELGLKILPPDGSERLKTVNWMMDLEKKYRIRISACSVPGLPISKCIDGELLQYLHSKNFKTNLSQPFKRTLCGCTESIDIGGWPPKVCYTGCQYCYSKSSY